MNWKFWRRNTPDIPPGRVPRDNVIDTGEIQMGPADIFGKPIQVLSRIVYPGSFARNKVQMVVAQVTEFTADGGVMVNVELRSREDRPGRTLVHLTPVGLRNAVVIG